jgi:hypothetical protein
MLARVRALACVPRGRRLWMAAWSGDSNRFKRLFDLNVDAAERRRLVAATNEHGWNAIHFAAVYGRIEMLQPMLHLAPELVHEPNRAGWLPLHYAAGFGQKDVIDVLVENGAVVGATNDNPHGEYCGFTPLHRAFRWWGSSGSDPTKGDAIRHLLSLGACPMAKDAAGRTPVDLVSDNCCALALEALAAAHTAGLETANVELQSEATRTRLEAGAAASQIGKQG